MVRERVAGRRASAAALAGLALMAFGSAGCVERRYTIRTVPDNALVVVNQEEIGPTPVSKSFVYYGDRDIIIMAPGYKTLRVVQPINAPWWDNGLTDFFTENLLPVTLRDEREFVYKLEPLTTPPAEELLPRAESLRAIGKADPPPRRRGILGWLGF